LKQGILVGCSNNELNTGIKNLLEQNNYYVVDTCLTGNEILRKATVIHPKIIILSHDISNSIGLKITEILIEDYKCIVILLLNQAEKSYAQRKYDNPNLYFIVKPVNKPVLLNTVEIALKVDRHIQAMNDKIKRLEDDIDSRIIIEKAKGIIMEKMNISEQAAYERLRKQSMNKKISMKDLAVSVIETMEEL